MLLNATKSKRANPTLRIQEKIIATLSDIKRPIAISNLSRKSNCSYYQVKSSIEFLEKLGVVTLITSEGNNCILVQLKSGDTNEPRT